MWDLIVSVPDRCLSFYFSSFVLSINSTKFELFYFESNSCVYYKKDYCIFFKEIKQTININKQN